MKYHRRHDDPASWKEIACCFIIALCLLGMVLVCAEAMDKQAVYDRERLDNNLTQAQRSEIMRGGK